MRTLGEKSKEAQGSGGNCAIAGDTMFVTIGLLSPTCHHGRRVGLSNSEKNGRRDRIRTCDIRLPKPALYQAELLSAPEERVISMWSGPEAMSFWVNSGIALELAPSEAHSPRGGRIISTERTAAVPAGPLGLFELSIWAAVWEFALQRRRCGRNRRPCNRIGLSATFRHAIYRTGAFRGCSEGH